MILIATQEVGSGGAASIEFTGIPQDADDLLLVLSARSSGSGTYQDVSVSINGVTTSRSYRDLYGNGSSTYSSNGGQISVQAAVGTSATANTFSNVRIYVTGYKTSNYKPFSYEAVTENNASGAQQQIGAGLWSSTSAITSLGLSQSGYDFAQYSTASLYKVKKA